MTHLKPKTIDEYLEALDHDRRIVLQKLRERIRKAAPYAEECISYRQPAFRQGRMLVGFGATKRHCTFYVMSSTILESFETELKSFETTKSTIRFQSSKPLPARLVRRLVEARLAENAASYEQRQR